MDLFFAKYEITEDRLISPEEMRKILVSLEDLPARGIHWNFNYRLFTNTSINLIKLVHLKFI